MIVALDPADERSYEVRVASSAALLVAKTHKILDRAKDSPERLVDKDAHDIYRLLVATPTETLVRDIARLQVDELAGETTMEAVDFLREDFAAGPTALGPMMAGRTEEGVGEPRCAPSLNPHFGSIGRPRLAANSACASPKYSVVSFAPAVPGDSTVTGVHRADRLRACLLRRFPAPALL